ncbi:unnamed protein product [Penicillium salamii]|nr:unnamed protein product [Penicillium salamii]CAG8280880.1 unnamed protein product [Penicillium salamii]CAG8411297.1 unnamed protein product [Penicillium salamii]
MAIYTTKPKVINRISPHLLNTSTPLLPRKALKSPPSSSFAAMPFHEKEFSTPPPHPPVGTPQNSKSALPWYSIAPGVWEFLLNGDTQEKAVLQWWEPDTTSAQTEQITHTYIEEVCTLRGGLEDLTLGQSWGIGAYAYRQPGMKHGPYRAAKEGCLQFVKILPAK